MSEYEVWQSIRDTWNSGPTDCLNFKNGQGNTKAQEYGPAYTLWTPLPWGTHALFFLYSPPGTDMQESESHTLLIVVPPALALGLSQSRHPENGP